MTNEERNHAINKAAFLADVLDKTCKAAKEQGVMSDEEIAQLRAEGEENLAKFKKERGI